MSHKTTVEERRANVAHWRFQRDLMAQYGFSLVNNTAATRKPYAYCHGNGCWRVRKARGGKWKLEQWTGRSIVPHGYGFMVKVWFPVHRYFDTPLAVALWFNILKRARMI